jgi:class 3 adenylate cyclase
MDPDATALFRELADRSPSEREEYYARHTVPAALRAEIESLLRFDSDTADSFHDHVAAAAHGALVGNPGAASPQPTDLLRGTKLTPGTRLGPYEIETPLGAGGMGIVFRARDIRLDRAVALKILPDRWAQDSDRLARFDREARILASMNHPSIAALFEIFEAEEWRVLVMELVEGPTLAERIRSERISVREALSVFLEVADGLEAAHERGVVHRDLKPANIKAPRDGRAKILDFGIAKIFVNEDGKVGSCTTLDLTTGAVLMGTPAYMSPEQARGHPVDKRADIWAYGCCLFETLTGVPAFAAETLSDTVARVLKDEPDWAMLPDSLPWSLRRLLSRCLRKDPRRRLRDIGDARLELEEAMDPSGSPAGPGISGTADFRAILVGRVLNLAAVTQRIGVAATSRRLARSEAIARRMMDRYQGREGDRTPEGFSATFDLPSDALRCALVCQTEWGKLESEDSFELAIGIHAAEVSLGGAGSGAGPQIESVALDTAVRVAGLAQRGQVLLSGAAAETARQQVTTAPDGSPVLWIDHGPYVFNDCESHQIFEAGVVGVSTLRRPADTATARRAPKPRPALRPISRQSQP